MDGVTNTNFLTAEAQVDFFLTEGAFVQTSTDSFKVFIGPFLSFSNSQLALQEARAHDVPVVYNPQFWGFLRSDEKSVTDTPDYLVPQVSLSMSRVDFQHFLSLSAEKINTQPIFWNAQSSTYFKEQFDWIQTAIASQRIFKALPISMISGVGDISARKSQILKTLAQTNSANFAYGSWTVSSGMIGYTPEVLSSWSKDQGELRTMALAGTWKKTAISPDFSDVKIKAEHNFVISDIEHQLYNYKLKHKSETAVIELPYLYHLKTNFIYECQSLNSFEKALQLLHPTAALGVYPREKQSLIEFSEINIQKKRQQFGAPFGYFDQDSALILVAIRNILWSQESIQLFAGCGVTANSDIDVEWFEILAKQDSVKKMLGI